MTTMINPQMDPLSEGLPSAEPMLFQQRVPRHLVHRMSTSEVFVTDLRVTGYNTFQVSARWPSAHSFYRPTTRFSHDPVLYLECLRQAGLLIAHVAFDVPEDFKFITHEKRFEISTDGLRTNGNRPVDVLITVTAHDIRRRGKGFAGMLFEYKCFRDDVQVGSAAIRWSCVSSAGYARLRGEHWNVTPLPVDDYRAVPAHVVGRRDERDVFLAESTEDRGWLLRLDPAHPVVFDHPVDHVPGMAAVEAARQAALIVLGEPQALPLAGDFALQRYVEFELPCLVVAEAGEKISDRTTRIRVILEQDGHIAAEGHLDMLGCA